MFPRVGRSRGDKPAGVIIGVNSSQRPFGSVPFRAAQQVFSGDGRFIFLKRAGGHHIVFHQTGEDAVAVFLRTLFRLKTFPPRFNGIFSCSFRHAPGFLRPCPFGHEVGYSGRQRVVAFRDDEGLQSFVSRHCEDFRRSPFNGEQGSFFLRFHDLRGRINADGIPSSFQGEHIRQPIPGVPYLTDNAVFATNNRQVIFSFRCGHQIPARGDIAFALPCGKRVKGGASARIRSADEGGLLKAACLRFPAHGRDGGQDGRCDARCAYREKRVSRAVKHVVGVTGSIQQSNQRVGRHAPFRQREEGG